LRGSHAALGLLPSPTRLFTVRSAIEEYASTSNSRRHFANHRAHNTFRCSEQDNPLVSRPRKHGFHRPTLLRDMRPSTNRATSPTHRHTRLASQTFASANTPETRPTAFSHAVLAHVMTANHQQSLITACAMTRICRRAIPLEKGFFWLGHEPATKHSW